LFLDRAASRVEDICPKARCGFDRNAPLVRS
jgi:hypothetical protein